MKSNTKPNSLGRKKYLALAIPLLMAAQVQGVEFNLGQIEGSFDSQISMGSSWRVESQDAGLIVNADGQTSNSDDGNKNFKSGDAFSQIFKGSHDLQFSYQNLGGFVRGKYWYDSAMANNSVDYGHTPTETNNGVDGAKLTYAGADTTLDDSNFNDLSKASGATLLDAFVYGEFEVMDMPLDVRLGKQVVSWGESTFIRGGINAINPVDVSAFRRPGAEIKEGLLPVNMLFANIGLSDNLSMETFYQLEFQETVIEGCGTFFSSNDYAAEGCDSASLAGGAISVARDEDGLRKAKDDGQFGLAFRYISEALGNTEFGLYFMNVHNRAPVMNGVYHSLTENQENALYQGALDFAYESAGVIQADIETAVATGDATAIAIYTAALTNAGGYLASQRAAGSGYFITYPEDLQIAGLSFASNVGSMALSGEVSHQLDVPVQINSSMLIQALLLGVEASSSTEIQNLDLEPGQIFQGYRTFDISQLQMTAIKFFDQVAGANRVGLIGEVGYTYIHGFEEGANAIKFGRSDIFGTPGEDNNEDDGFVTTRSWGYRGRLVAEYSDVFMGINLKPMLAWSHDVKGYAPQPGGNFIEGQKSLGLSVQATYLQTYNANLSYTRFMGGDYSTISDRDFAAISVGMQF